MKMAQKVALIFTIVGAVNWGLIGLLNFNLVDFLFGVDSLISNIVYIIVGITGLLNIGIFTYDFKEMS